MSISSATHAVNLPDMTRPHEKFPMWSRPELYDRVTAMFMDSWDDAEVARSLAEEAGVPVGADTVTSVRKEAGMVAETMPTDIRRRWIYRYRNLTVNNLVKEYMFIEGKYNFLKAKREFAAEVEQLVQKTPPERLWIAINDALGRNNISLELVLELLAYQVIHRKIERLVASHAERHHQSTEQAMHDVAGRLSSFIAEQDGRDTVRCAQFLATLLAQSESVFTREDVDFFVELGKHANDSDTPDQSYSVRITRGADTFVKAPSVIDRILLGDVSNHLSSAEIAQIVVALRTRPVIARDSLEALRSYTSRHITGLKTMAELGRGKEIPSQLRVVEVKALESSQKVVNDHLVISDYRQFFTEPEMAQAAAHRISMDALQKMLDTLNGLSTMDEVLTAVPGFSRTTFVFPTDRYCLKRFGSKPKATS